MRNTVFSGTAQIPQTRPSIRELERDDTAIRLLTERLPSRWEVTPVRPFYGPDGGQFDMLLGIRAPTGQGTTMVVAVKSRVEARDIPWIVEQTRAYNPDLPAMVVAPFLSLSTRRALRERGLGYADLTGNIYVVLDDPAVYIFDHGADSDPWREERPLHSLRGRAAGRVVRALCDYRPPYGVRELSVRSDTPVASVSRVVSLLEAEALVDRSTDGAILGVHWWDLLHRWARDYGLTRSNRAYTYLEPRGLNTLLDRLPGVVTQYAITGSLAAANLVPYAPTRLATIYAESTPALAAELGLRAVESATNVLLLEPFDPVVFERTSIAQDITFAAVSQIAVDLLTSPGRGPVEGEELLSWMAEREDDWRS